MTITYKLKKIADGIYGVDSSQIPEGHDGNYYALARIMLLYGTRIITNEPADDAGKIKTTIEYENPSGKIYTIVSIYDESRDTVSQISGEEDYSPISENLGRRVLKMNIQSIEMKQDGENSTFTVVIREDMRDG